jgi:hypothetical protein
MMNATSAGTISFLLDRWEGGPVEPSRADRHVRTSVSGLLLFGAKRTANPADHARIDLQMTAITAGDANTVYIPVHNLQKASDSLMSAPLSKTAVKTGHGPVEPGPFA